MLELLLMDEEIQEKIYKLLVYAETNPFDYDSMLYAYNNNEPIIPMGNNNYEIDLPLEYRVVYTVEEHPMGICRHISISKENKIPEEMEELKLILETFSFSLPMNNGDYHTYKEECVVNGEECTAINFIQKMF